ncbi:MAG: ATP-binding cassette domain-containing protein [Salinibacterium sp.]|nr:ATP-binding cassette domain-containing protein [Salinibacterium sp.]
MSLTAAVRVPERSVDLDLTVSRGRTLALLGPNGAGKSTVLGAIAGVVASVGQITLGGRPIENAEVEDRRVGYVFQDYLLFPHLSVLENVAFGPRSQGRGRAASRSVAGEWLDRLGIGALAARRPAELSGGQAQRVALARALAAEPELLLLDEPLSALDVEVRAEVREELARHVKEWGGLTILVTHSLDDVAALADDVIVLEKGRATQRATVRELVAAPATPYVSRLVATWSED